MQQSARKILRSLFLPLGALVWCLGSLQAAPLPVVVAEVAWMGTAVSANDEWITLYNNSPDPVDLTDWTLTAADGTPSITLIGSIPAGGYFLLERTNDDTLAALAADQVFTGALGNEGETLTLRDADGALVDQVPHGSGWAAGHGDARVPMRRVDLAVAGDQAANWAHNPRCGTPQNSAGLSYACTLTTTAVGRDLDYAVYFNERVPGAAGTTTDITPMEAALLALIDNAAVSVDITIYGLNRQSVVDALTAAHGRGVAVRVVGDNGAMAEPGYSNFYLQLQLAGIPLVTDSSSYLQHNKFLIVDGEVVWTGSTNFTDTGFTLNANNSIVISDTTLAAIYSAEFAEMWSGDFQTQKSDNVPHLLDYNGTLVEVYFSPTDIVSFAVRDELRAAQESLHFALFFWTDRMLAEEVAALIPAGLGVYGMWDWLGETNVSSQDEFLCAAGGRIGIEPFPGKLHHKFAVIDATGGNPAVILGSYNWTNSGAYKNDENTLIIHDADLAELYLAEWDRLWAGIELADICNPQQILIPFITNRS